MTPIFLTVKEGVAPSSYWDHTFLLDLLADLPEGDRQAVLIPGAYQGDAIEEINLRLKEFPKVMVFITSDEEGKFDCSKLEHPDMIHHCQYGNCDSPFPIGYTAETRKQLKKIGLVEKDIDVFFAGQLNSQERKSMFVSHVYDDRTVLFGTEGFSRGLTPEQYYYYMAHTKLAPSPGGWVSPDSFRFYEALEAGAVPIDYPSYMKKLFPDFPDIRDNRQIFAWWIRKKQELKRKLREELGCPPFATTVVITTSPIPSHPSMEIIEETIESIRHYLDCEIIIAIDGVRYEQERMRKQYEEYVAELLWACNYRYKNVSPVVFQTHHHQSGMMREILPLVKTPLLLFVEHDTPLVTDEPIDFIYLQETLLAGKANMIRFHYEAFIPKEHKYLMIGEPKDQLQATAQWSQRPHIARTDFYEDIIHFFSENSNCFIEDLMHSVLQAECQAGKWDRWKVFIYHPDGNIKRSLNLDGRGSDVKYEKEQVW